MTREPAKHEWAWLIATAYYLGAKHTATGSTEFITTVLSMAHKWLSVFPDVAEEGFGFTYAVDPVTMNLIPVGERYGWEYDIRPGSGSVKRISQRRDESA